MRKPKTPEEVIEFIGSNFNSMETEIGDTGVKRELDDVTYSLTVHDILSAFQGADVGFIERLNNDLERYERGWYLRGDALEKLQQWAESYPVEVFPEMTSEEFKQASEVLKAAGLCLDRISASNIRYVITQARKIVDEGLAA